MRSIRNFKMPSPAMAVAIVALFVALSGSAVAATQLSKGVVNTSSIRTKAVTNSKIRNSAVTSAKIKNRTVLGKDIRNNTLTGTQINESKLGQVPDSAKVGGIPASNLLTKDDIIRWNIASNRGDPAKTLATFGPFTITGRCEVNGANTDAIMEITTSVDDVYADDNNDLDVGEVEELASRMNFAAGDRNQASNETMFFDPTSGLSSFDDDGEPTGIWTGFPGADCRFVGVVELTRP